MSSAAIPKTTPYDAAIAEVRAKLDELKTTLATLLRLQGEHSGGFSSPGRTETEISHDTFFGMTIADAAKKFLSMVKATKPTAEIAEALERGGLKHSSKDFSTTVRSILGSREDFTRVPNGDWGLGDWYPGQGRGKKPKVEKLTKKTQAQEVPKKRQLVHPGSTKDGFSSDSIGARTLALLDANRAQIFSAPEIADRIKAAAPSVAASLSDLLKHERIVRPEKGRYQSKASA